MEKSKTSLLRRLQTQTLPDEAPSIGKIHPFSKMAVKLLPLVIYDIMKIWRKRLT